MRPYHHHRGKTLMRKRTFVRNAVRGLVLAALVLGAFALPAVASAQTVPSGVDIGVDRPTDGVGDSPLVP
jgi:hypothetical protein